MHVPESRDMEASNRRLAGGVLRGRYPTESMSPAKIARVSVSGPESGCREWCEESKDKGVGAGEFR